MSFSMNLALGVRARVRSFVQRTPSKAKFLFFFFFSRKVGQGGVIFEEDQN